MALHRLVDGWIREFQSGDESKDAENYANQLLTDTHLIDALFTILTNPTSYPDLVDPICEQLLVLYRSGNDKLKYFVIAFLPSLLSIEFASCESFGITRHKSSAQSTSKNESKSGLKTDRRNSESVKVLLLGIYNIETVDEEGKPIVRTFRLPLLTKPSVYHEPNSLTTGLYHSSAMQLTESALQKHEIGGETRISSFGPYPEVDSIVASTRMTVFTVLMKIYNRHISHLSRKSLEILCQFCIKMLDYVAPKIREEMTNGDRVDEATECDSVLDLFKSSTTRILLSSSFLVELAYSVYFALFNSVTDLGLEALEVIHERAYIELFPDVLLMTSAIRNSLEVNPSGQPSDGPMGISVALSPTTNTTSAAHVSKTAITNASFKTKKLPDDIPIVTDGNNPPAASGQQSNANNTSALSAITEDEDGNEVTPTGDKGTSKSTQGSGSKGLTPTLGKMNVKNLLREKKERRKELRESKKHHHQANENGELKVPLKSAVATSEMSTTHDSDNGNLDDSFGETSQSNKRSNSDVIPMKIFSKEKNSSVTTSDQQRPHSETSGGSSIKL